MPKKPEPWYWAARKCYYIQLNGKQVKLDPDPRKAKAMWHRLMAEDGGLEPKEKLSLSIPEIADLFLSSRDGRRTSTMDKYNRFLIPWAVANSKRKLRDVRLSDIVTYCNRREEWGEGTKRTLYSMIVTLLRWAREAGYADANPLAGAMCPWHPQDNRRPMTRAEYEAVLGAAKDPGFRLLMRVLWSTGCRPGEAYSLRADQLHPIQPIATLSPSEHKTGGRTGKKRYLIFPGGVMEELRKQAVKHPTGELIRNTQGRPWNRRHVCYRFDVIRKRLGLPAHVVPYSTRHSLATDLAESNPDKSTVFLAKIMGHANAKTFEAVYYHPEMVDMIETVERQRGEPTTAPSLPAVSDSGSQSSAQAPRPECPRTSVDPSP